MDLRDKLRFYETSLKSHAESTVSQRYELEQWVSGSQIENEEGSFFMACRSVSAGHRHGISILAHEHEVRRSVYALASKDQRLETFDPRKALYIDTETTGLAGGTGTVPFLIGAGFYTDSGFTVEQYFIRDYHEEKAMLLAFMERLSCFESLVTYNGKCFDIPLIASRLILHRLTDQISAYPHFDLLFTIRRLYKRRLSDCSLGNIENQILTFRRVNDIPSFMIPGIYFRYLHTGDGERLPCIFEHNFLDILSLSALTLHTAEVYQNPESMLSQEQDWYSLGIAFEKINLPNQATECFKKVLESERSSPIHNDTRLRLGIIHKRNRQWDLAINQWQRMIQTGMFSVQPYEELAKYYEHHARDYVTAIMWVTRAIDHLQIQMDLRSEKNGHVLDRLKGRLERLQRKSRLQKLKSGI
jgi:uncharacterized protein YprB with RNaseH-like and TPR domain